MSPDPGTSADHRSADRALAILLVRVLFGVLFLTAGIYKVCMVGPMITARLRFVEPYATTFFPASVLWTAGVVLPSVELVAGALVLAGLFTRPALWALGGVLLALLFGHLVKEPYHVINGYTLTRTGLFAVLLLLPPELDRFSMDSLLRPHHD